MSVLFFNEHDLGNIVACLLPVIQMGAEVREEYREHYSKAAAEFSKRNAAAFCQQYRHEVIPFSAEVIAEASRRVTPDLCEAIRTAALLNYNLITNDGDHKGRAETYEAMTRLLSSVLAKVAKQLRSKEVIV